MEAVAHVSLEQAVDEYLEFIRVPHPEIPYETRQDMKTDLLKQLIISRAERKRGES